MLMNISCWIGIRQLLCSYLSLFYDGAQLPYEDSKYPSMVHEDINLNTAADAALRPFTAGTIRIE